MLVLSRKINETICIGPTIEVRVLGASGNRVKLGIVGPPDIVIHREEIYRRIRQGLPRALPAGEDSVY